MARRHWQPFGETDSLRGLVTIYRKRFNLDVNEASRKGVAEDMML